MRFRLKKAKSGLWSYNTVQKGEVTILFGIASYETEKAKFFNVVFWKFTFLLFLEEK